MSDKTQPEPTETPSTDEAVVVPTRLQMFVINYPRASRVVAIAGGLTAIAGVVTVTNTVRKNKHHLVLAGDHASEAAAELSNAVSPSPETV